MRVDLSLKRCARSWSFRALAVAFFCTLAVVAGLLFGQTAPVVADSVVTNCTTSGVQAALSTGGLVTFNCGGPVTIPILPTLVVTQSATLAGGGMVSLDGGGAMRIISVANGVALTLTNVTLRNGYAADGQGGGGVRLGISATLVSSSAVFTNNRATTAPFPSGAAIFGSSGSAVILANSTILSNTAGFAGGGVYSVATVTIDGSTIKSNTAGFGGGGVIALTATVTGSMILSNTAGFAGGGLYATTATIAASTIGNNRATGDRGGGLFAESSASITGSSIVSNSAGTSGGGAFSNSSVTIGNSAILSNTAGFAGGGVNATSTAIVALSNIAGNAAGFGGGGVVAITATITGSTIVSNTGGIAGGGLIATAAIIDASTFVGNRATTQTGGAIYADTARLTNATLTANSAAVGGGAVLFSSSLAMTNTTAFANGSRAISASVASLPFTLTDSIVGGGAAPRCSQAGNLAGKNVVEDTSCGTGSGLIQANPDLGPLQDNGGPTSTMAPASASPAVNASPGCQVATDQRGVQRVAPCDVGAYETGGKPALLSLSPATAFTLDPAFTLTVAGNGFVTGTVALWNGSPRTTVVLNFTTLAVAIPAADLVASGVVPVSARYGLAADSVSNSLPFAITVPRTLNYVPTARKEAGLE